MLTCFLWLCSGVSADCTSPIKVFPHLDACHCEFLFNDLSHGHLRCPNLSKGEVECFQSEGRTGTFSEVCVLVVVIVFGWGFFCVLWRRRRSHGKASGSYLSREAGSGSVRGLVSFNTSLVTHLSQGRTAEQLPWPAESVSSRT